VVGFVKHARPGAIRQIRIRRAAGAVALVSILWLSGAIHWLWIWLGTTLILGVGALILILPGGN
jgi:hypothetical protein